MMDDIHRILYKRSEENFKQAIVEPKDMEALKKAVEGKKLSLVPYCNDGECEDFMKEETGGAKTLNSPFDKPVKKGAKCIRCGKDAKCNMYVAKSY
jgi:prolyl-tRNA synthetase